MTLNLQQKETTPMLSKLIITLFISQESLCNHTLKVLVFVILKT